MVHQKRNNQNRYPYGFDFGYSWWTMLNESRTLIKSIHKILTKCKISILLNNILKNAKEYVILSV